ncbi:hypothetical protein [Marinagarivorans cellulosilyticus]|uniref:hypothetical protein n=1 Tax=Marinagarivorans cellulosilyticus TaxID=2721545 RepID=UPI001F24EB94|nr:hypothetical protein [Marinagarivorans cellulosilyticus]
MTCSAGTYLKGAGYNSRSELPHAKHNQCLKSSRPAKHLPFDNKKNKPPYRAHSISSCATTYIDQLFEALRELTASAKISRPQKLWLTTVLMGIVITRKLNWAVIEGSKLNEYRQDGLRWMFSHSKMPWESLISASTRVLIKHYSITSGTLTIDDSDKLRSSNTPRIAHAHKVKDKSAGCYGKGQ